MCPSFRGLLCIYIYTSSIYNIIYIHYILKIHVNNCKYIIHYTQRILGCAPLHHMYGVYTGYWAMNHLLIGMQTGATPSNNIMVYSYIIFIAMIFMNYKNHWHTRCTYIYIWQPTRVGLFGPRWKRDCGLKHELHVPNWTRTYVGFLCTCIYHLI